MAFSELGSTEAGTGMRGGVKMSLNPRFCIANKGLLGSRKSPRLPPRVWVLGGSCESNGGQGVRKRNKTNKTVGSQVKPHKS